MSTLRRPKYLLRMAAMALLVITAQLVTARPTDEKEVRAVVDGWLALDSTPFDAKLGTKIRGVKAFSDDVGTILYYVVYLDPNGFAIVSADDRINPIVAFSTGVKYDPSSDNPLGAMVSKDMPGRLQHLRSIAEDNKREKRNEAQFRKAREKWATLKDLAVTDKRGAIYGIDSVSDVRVSPLIQSEWSQGNADGDHCYNYYTPNHYVCGCVATAIAQIMRFWEYPVVDVGTGSYTVYVDDNAQNLNLRGGDGDGGPYDWVNMVLIPAATTLNEAQRQAIGALTYDCGLSVNMMYGPYGSGAYGQAMAPAFTDTFHYSNAISGNNNGYNIGRGLDGMVNPNLDAGNPVLFGIYSEGGGHAVVCDGYGYQLDVLYHHVNLGWAGSQDAWYDLPIIGSSDEFTTVAFCIYNILPDADGEIISGRVLDQADGTPIDGASIIADSGSEVYEAVTNSQGIYALTSLPSNTQFTISASKDTIDLGTRIVSTGTSTDNAAVSGNVWEVNFPPQTPLYISTVTIPDAEVDTSYSTTLQAEGGFEPYHWSVRERYKQTQETASWYGNGVGQGWHSDDASWSYSLPFTFTFYGVDYNSVNICSNGFLDFVSGATTWDNSDGELISNVRIAPLWYDLRTNGSAQPNEDIYITETAEYVVIRWRAETFSAEQPVNFEAVLHINGKITFNYGSAPREINPTVGISGGDGIFYTLSSRTDAFHDTSDLFSPEDSLPPGLSLQSDTGALTGTPSAYGQFQFTVLVHDSSTPAQGAERQFDMTVHPDTGLTGFYPTVPDNPDPADGAVGVTTSPVLTWDDVLLAHAFGGDDLMYFSTSGMRGNVYRFETSRSLRQIGVGLNYTGAADLYFFVLQSSSLDGTYSVVHQEPVTLYGDGHQVYRCGRIDVPLQAGVYYVIGVAWDDVSMSHYEVPVALPESWEYGNVEKMVVLNNITVPLSGAVTPWTTTDQPGMLQGMKEMELCFDNEGPAAAVYDIYFDSSPNLTQPAQTDLQQPEWTPSVLQEDIYYWKIVARNSAASAESEVWSFDTGVPAYEILCSTNSDRSEASSLDGDIVNGNVHIFTSPDNNVSSVSFYLDGAFHRTEGFPPFDFNGTAIDGTALAFNTNTLSNDLHTIFATITLNDGSIVELDAAFSVQKDTSVSELRPTVPLNPVPPDGETDVSTSKTLQWQESLLKRTFGWDKNSYTGTNRLRGNVYHFNQNRRLRQIGVALNFTGTTDLYFYVLQSPTLDGSYSVLFEDRVTTTGSGQMFYASDRFDLTLEANTYYGIGVAWNSTSVTHYESPEALPMTWEYGTVEKMMIANNITAPLAGPVVPWTTIENPVMLDAVKQVSLYFENEGPYAAKYDVYFGTSPQFTAPAVSGLDTASWRPSTPFAHNQVYYWMVNASNSAGEADSETWSFATGGTGAVYDILYSTNADRSNPQSLNGQSVDGVIYAFTAPDDDVQSVDFYLDDPTMQGDPHQKEGKAIFDFNGTADNGDANPWPVPDGNSHTISAEIFLVNGTSTVLHATFNESISDDYLFYSLHPDRRNPQPLANAAVSGDIYVFTVPDNEVQRVDFYLDDPSVSTPYHSESLVPFDFVGAEDDGTAKPWTVPDGNPHAISARIHFLDGTSTTATAAFNKSKALWVSPAFLSFNLPSGGGTDQETLQVSASDGSSAAFSAGVSPSSTNWLSVSPSSGSPHSNLNVSVNGTGLANGSYEATIQVIAGGYMAAEIPVTLTVGPVVQFQRPVSTVNEAVTAAGIQVALSEALDHAVTINYAVTGGTATPGQDFVLEDGTVEIESGETITNIFFDLTNDDADEVNETIVVELTGASGATAAGTVLHTFIIADDDPFSSTITTVGASGSTTWGYTYTDLRAAFAAAPEGSEIWIAEGTYQPHPTDPDISFEPPAGVAVYGGFSGTEQNRDQRVPDTHVTTLSGGGSDIWQRTYHILKPGNCVLLDGLTVTGGHAISPQLAEGGAIFANSIALLVKGCEFVDNSAYGYDYDDGPSRARGGAISILNGRLNAIMTRFYGNSTWDMGGSGDAAAIYAENSVISIRSCEFVRNQYYGAYQAEDTGALTTVESSVELEECLFEDNWSGQGAAADFTGKFVAIKNCTFRKNYSEYRGGAIVFKRCDDIILKKCVFSENNADDYGGVFSASNCTMATEDCIFAGNYTASFYRISQGGVCTLENGMYSFQRCAFLGNVAFGTSYESDVGVADVAGATLSFVNCIFSGNAIPGDGAGEGSAVICRNTGGTISLENCTITGNHETSEFDNSLFRNTDNGALHFRNTIIWGNFHKDEWWPPDENPNPEEPIAAIINDSTSDSSISYSAIEHSGGSGAGWNSAYGTDGGGNIDADPLFVNAENPMGDDGECPTDDDGLQLSAASPCIDSGTSVGAPGTDIFGQPRPFGAEVDMGAYESQENDDGNLDIYYSFEPDREPRSRLNGKTIAAGTDICVFTYADNDVKSVTFDLDGHFYRTENLGPFDFNGTASGEEQLAIPWQVPDDQPHTITAGITKTDGSTEVIHAIFNQSKRLQLSPNSFTFDFETAGATDQSTISVTASEGNPDFSVSITPVSPSDASWLVSPTSSSTGTAPDSLTVRVDSSGLPDGTYTAKIKVEASDYQAAMAQVTMNIGLQGPDIVYYSYSDYPTNGGRENASQLDGAVVSGEICVFTWPDDGINGVAFDLDGVPYHSEGVAPFDFNGTALDDTAYPFDTETLSDGPHSITAHFTMSDGSDPTVTANFTVANNAPSLSAQPPELSFTLEQDQTDQATVQITASDSGSPSLNITDSGETWLNSTAAGATVTVSVNSTGANPGTYTGSVQVNAAGYTGVTIPVRFQVLGDENGLVAHWRFDEASGSIAYDSSGNGHDGTISGAQRAAGQSGGALQFDGSNDFVQVPHSSSLAVANQLTAMAWVKIDNPSLARHMRIISTKSAWDSASGFELQYNPDRNYFSAVSAGTTVGKAENCALDTGWHHLAAVFNGNTATFYIDGVDCTTSPAITPVKAYSNPLYIGCQVGTTDWFDGAIDDVRLYGRTLSATEIQQIAGQTPVECTMVPSVPDSPVPVNSSIDIPTNTDLSWQEVLLRKTFGETEMNYTGRNSFRGNVYRFNSTRALKEIGVGLNFTGSINLYFYVLQSSTVDGSYTVAAAQVRSMTGNGQDIYRSGRMNVSLQPGIYYAIGVAWGDVDVTHYESSASLPADWEFGSVEKMAVVNNIILPVSGSVTPWTAGDQPGMRNGMKQVELSFANEGDCAAVYDVYLGTSQTLNTPQITGLTSTSWSPPNLQAGTDYFWKVIARNSAASVPGSVWTFRTADSAPPPTTAAAHWRFDEASGTMVTDSSGNGNNGTVYGATRTSGYLNGALHFDGSNDYVNIANSAILNPTGALTLSVWIRVADPNLNRYMRIIAKKTDWNTASGYEMQYNPGEDYLSVMAGGSSVGRAYNVALDSNWHHVAAVVSNGTATIYADGRNVTTSSAVGPLVANSNPLRIGSQLNGTNFFYGDIDEVAIFARALSAAEIATLAGGGIAVSEETALLEFSDNTEDSSSAATADSASAEQEVVIYSVPNWLLPFYVNDREVPSVMIGIDELATNGFDEEFDTVAPLQEYQELDSVLLDIENLTELISDVRAPGDEPQVWILQIINPNNATGLLRWQPQDLPDSIQPVLTELDENGEPITGSSVNLQEVNDLTLTGESLQIFEIRTGDR